MAQITFEQLTDELFDAIVKQMEVNKKDISYDSRLSTFGDSLDWAEFVTAQDPIYRIPYTHNNEAEQLSMKTILDLVKFYAKHTNVPIPEKFTTTSKIDSTAYYKPVIKTPAPNNNAVPTQKSQHPIRMVRQNNTSIIFRKGGQTLSLNDPKVSAILERIKQELENTK